MKGKLICIVGGDGVGKTSVIEKVYEILTKKGLVVTKTREPGGVESAEKIRDIILNYNIDGITEALLFAGARRENVVNNIKPALKRGEIVLTDRYLHCSLVYQGIARGLGYENVLEINRLAIEDCIPDLTIVLDMDTSKAIKRLSDRNDINRLDKETLEFKEKVRNGYLSLANKMSNIVVINSDQKLEDVVEDVMKKITPLI